MIKFNYTNLRASDVEICNGTATSTKYIHTDHLGGSSVITDENGNIVELTDYYPFGDIRLDEKAGSFSEQRKFTGHEYDKDTDLTYANARYYPAKVGRFLSQDPAFLAVGDNEALKKITKLKTAKYLENPQNLNSYSYTINNPLKHVDESGEFGQSVFAGGVGFLVGVGVEYIGDLTQSRGVEGKRGLSSLVPREGFFKRAAINGAETGVIAATFAANPLAGIVATPVASIFGDYFAGESINVTDATLKTGTTIFSAGLLKGFPKVPGRYPNIGSKSFFFGEHAQRGIGESLIGGVLDTGVNTLNQVRSNDAINRERRSEK